MERCRCVLASRSVLWLLFSFAAFGACLIGFISPEWLTGQGLPATENDANGLLKTPVASEKSTSPEQKIGPLKSCRYRAVEDEVACLFLTWESFETAAWKASVILQGLGTVVVFFAVLLGIVSFWKQNLGRFNIISIAGLVQGVAVPLLASGLTVYPLAWSSESVKDVCGNSAGDYNVGDCSVGWALWAMAVGTLLTLLTSLLSPRAAKACNSHIVEEKIQLGHSCICVL